MPTTENYNRKNRFSCKKILFVINEILQSKATDYLALLGDGLDNLRHQQPISLKISVGHQHSKDVTNIQILSPTLENCHQHKVTNIYLSQTFM